MSENKTSEFIERFGTELYTDFFRYIMYDENPKGLDFRSSNTDKRYGTSSIHDGKGGFGSLGGFVDIDWEKRCNGYTDMLVIKHYDSLDWNHYGSTHYTNLKEPEEASETPVKTEDYTLDPADRGKIIVKTAQSPVIVTDPGTAIGAISLDPDAHYTIETTMIDPEAGESVNGLVSIKNTVAHKKPFYILSGKVELLNNTFEESVHKLQHSTPKPAKIPTYDDGGAIYRASLKWAGDDYGRKVWSME